MPTFVSFASEDARYRDYFIEHSNQPWCPYQVIDYSAHEAFSEQWKRKMRQKIVRSAVTVMMIGPSTHLASNAIWEVELSLLEGVPAFGLLIHQNLRVRLPKCFHEQHVIPWTQHGVARMFAQAAEYHHAAGGYGWFEPTYGV